MVKKGEKALLPLCITLLEVSLDSTDYILGVPRVSSDVLVVCTPGKGHFIASLNTAH